MSPFARVVALLSVLPTFAIAQGIGQCPSGQLATSETAGRCCWPAQRWSEQQGCVGAPLCPVGSVATGETCVPTPPPPPPQQPPQPFQPPPPAQPQPPQQQPQPPAGSQLEPPARVGFRVTGGVLFGSWLGGQLGLRVEVPVFQPLRMRALSGYAFVSAEAGGVYFQQLTTSGLLHTVAGLVGLTAGWNQRIAIFSIVPRIGPAIIAGGQWDFFYASVSPVYVVGIAGVDFTLHLGRLGFTIGGDYLFNLTSGVWLTRLGLSF